MIFYFRSNEQHISLKDQLRQLNNVESICANKEDSSRVLLLQRIGEIHLKQSEFVEAVKFLRQSIDLVNLHRSSPSVNYAHVIRSYYRLSQCFESLDRLKERMIALDSCATIARRLNSEDKFCMAALYERAQYFFDIGDYHRCMEHASLCEQLARSFTKTAGSENQIFGREYIHSSLGWQVNSSLSLKDYITARELLRRQIREVSELGNLSQLATAYEQLAELKVEDGKYSEARSYFESSIRLGEKSGKLSGCITTLNNMGYEMYFQRLHDLSAAFACFRRALAFRNRIQNTDVSGRIEAFNVLGNMATIYSKEGIFDSSFHYFQLAFNQFKAGITDSDFLKSSLNDFVINRKIYYLTDLLMDKGDAYLRQFATTADQTALDHAIQTFKTTDRVLEKIRIEQSEIQSKLFWRKDTRRLYEHALEAAFDAGRKEDAFYFFERSRAVLLSDQLSQLNWMGNEEISEQTQLRKKVNELEKELNATPDSLHRHVELESEIFTRKSELDRLDQRIKIRNPLYYQTIIDSTSIMVKEVREKLLNDHAALVELFTGDSSVFIMVVTINQLQLLKVNVREYESLSKGYRSFIFDASSLNRDFAGFQKVSFGLYKLLFENIQLPKGRIIISTDGLYFPFEALLTQQSADAKAYFLYDHAVSYTPSARFLLASKRNAANGKEREFLGIAPEVYPNEFSLASLPGSSKSVTELASYFHTADKIEFKEATKGNFLRMFPNYAIVQLYAHATDSGQNGEPCIYFADSSLNLSELMSDTRPNARLVVLGACETGVGKLYPGEGIFSFNREFAAIGIPSSIINLGNVDNEATFEITSFLYQFIAEGLPVDIALQRAKLKFLENSKGAKKLPSYWSATILSGKTDAVIVRKSNRRLGLIGAAIVLVALAWIVRSRILRKRDFVVKPIAEGKN